MQKFDNSNRIRFKHIYLGVLLFSNLKINKFNKKD